MKDSVTSDGENKERQPSKGEEGDQWCGWWESINNLPGTFNGVQVYSTCDKSPCHRTSGGDGRRGSVLVPARVFLLPSAELCSPGHNRVSPVESGPVLVKNVNRPVASR